MAKVLVIEDCSIMRELIGLQLATAGHTVEKAEDGLCGLQAARRSRPDVIVSNVDMPVLDGFECIAALRTERTARNIPVIFISSQTERESAAREFSASAFVSKPVSLNGLLGLVSEHARA